MDDLEELDRVLDEHFGRKPGESQTDLCAYGGEEDTDGDGWGKEDDRVKDTENRLSDRVAEFLNGGSDSDVCEDIADDEGSDSQEDDDFTEGTFKCNCSTQCLEVFQPEEVAIHRLNVREMDKTEKEMYIMGVLRPVNTSKTWRGERKRKRVLYTFNGKKICRFAFQYVFDIGRRTLTALSTHVHINGCVPRTHGNKNRKPRHALKYDEVKKCVDFLARYAEENGLPQPAAPRGRDHEAPIFLPASLTKFSIHKEYKDECIRQNVRSLGLSSFKTTWVQCVPDIKISTPRDDVCQKCELIRKKIKDAVSEEDKLEGGNELTNHITKAQTERSFYKQSINDSLEETPKLRGTGPIPPCSTDLQHTHYTFDYCQQVGIPHHYRQMGPVYFMTPRKVQIFGFRDDGLPMQYNYLIDEDQTIGVDGGTAHGPNAVISMVDHALTWYGHDEKCCVLHCDNCPGQNKNRFLLAYLSWRTMVGLHENISLHMQVPGHTRCYVDSGFAHIKKLYRRSDVDSLSQLVNVVNKSAVTNTAVPYIMENEEQSWYWRDWKSFLPKYFKPLPGISKFYHFQFCKAEPGIVYVKQNVDGVFDRKVLIRQNVVLNQFERPCILTPAGLSEQRKRYLYTVVRPIVRPECRDATCPPVDEE